MPSKGHNKPSDDSRDEGLVMQKQNVEYIIKDSEGVDQSTRAYGGQGVDRVISEDIVDMCEQLEVG